MLNVWKPNFSKEVFRIIEFTKKDLKEFQAIFIMLSGEFKTLKYTDEFSR